MDQPAIDQPDSEVIGSFPDGRAVVDVTTDGWVVLAARAATLSPDDAVEVASWLITAANVATGVRPRPSELAAAEEPSGPPGDAAPRG